MARAKLAAVVPVFVLLVGASGCADPQGGARFATPGASAPNRSPASAAGGACYLMEYEVIEQSIGTSFDVAAASANGDTFTCVLQTNSGSYPDLTLAVTVVGADPAEVMPAVRPQGSAAVTALGKAGYSAVVPAGAGAGPGVEIGWIAGNGRLLVLRYRPAPAAASGEVAALAPKLVALAKRIDQAGV
jgi:hypothetical protein